MNSERVPGRALTAMLVGIALSGCMAVPIVAINRSTPHLAAHCGTEGSAQRNCETLSYGGTERSYRVYVPSQLTRPAPLLVVLHGAYQDGAGIEAATGKGLDRLADETGALLVYPDSAGLFWNISPPAQQQANGSEKGSVDDVGFLRALVTSLAQHYPVDPERVFVTGFSNGGKMTLRLACEASDVYRGFVAVGASLTEWLAPNCHPSVARRVALIHGTADAFDPYGGGRSGMTGLGPRAIGAEATLATFSTLAGCRSLETGPLPHEGENTPTNVIVHRATACPDDLQFVLFEIQGGLHVWPGGVPAPQSLASRVNKPEAQLDANAQVWQFLGLERIPSQAQASSSGGARP